MGVDQYKQVATQGPPPGDVTVGMQFDADAPKPGTGGTVTLWASGEKIGEGRMDRTVALCLSFYAGMEICRPRLYGR